MSSCNRLGISLSLELYQSKLPLLSRIKFIRFRLSTCSAHVAGVADQPPRPCCAAGDDQRRFSRVVTAYAAAGRRTGRHRHTGGGNAEALTGGVTAGCRRRCWDGRWQCGQRWRRGSKSTGDAVRAGKLRGSGWPVSRIPLGVCDAVLDSKYRHQRARSLTKLSAVSRTRHKRVRRAAPADVTRPPPNYLTNWPPLPDTDDPAIREKLVSPRRRPAL